MGFVRQWFTRQARSPNDRGWLGVHARGTRIAAAFVRGEHDGKPTVGVCAAFDGDEAASRLLHWQRAQGEAARGQTSLLLDPHDYQILMVDAPPVSEEERRDAVRWRLKDMLDFPADEASIDCIAIPAAMPGEASHKLLAVVSKKATVGQWMLRYRDAGLSLTAIDIPELALRNVALLAGGETAHAFLHVGLEATQLIMLWQRELCAFRQLDLTAAQWATASEDARAELADRLSLEVQRTVDAFARQFSAADLAGLWVSSVTDPDGVSEALAPLVTLAIHPFRLEDQVNLEGTDKATDLGLGIDHTLSIGAALRARVATP